MQQSLMKNMKEDLTLLSIQEKIRSDEQIVDTMEVLAEKARKLRVSYNNSIIIWNIVSNISNSQRKE